jgi:hypothetical protein
MLSASPTADNANRVAEDDSETSAVVGFGVGAAVDAVVGFGVGFGVGDPGVASDGSFNKLRAPR